MSTFHGEIDQPKLIYKGAEAEIYLQRWLGQPAIRKHRVTKAYRIPQLDETIRRTRTVHEATIMQEVRKLGVSVPTVRHIDPQSCTIVMEYINGPTLKEELYHLSSRDRRSRCKSLGQLLGQMHRGGIVHGDMTISNVLSEAGKLFMIDFGLADHSTEFEDRGVDLLLLNRAMKSTHYTYYAILFETFIEGYSRAVGTKESSDVLRKMREIERRGRYFERS